MARRYSYFPLSSTYQGALLCPFKGRSPLTGIGPPRPPAPEYLWAKRSLYALSGAESIETCIETIFDGFSDLPPFA
jgi:hypothetical protein